jgi:hypothetical protein
MDGSSRRDFGIIRRARVMDVVYRESERTGEAYAIVVLDYSGEEWLFYISVANELAFKKLRETRPSLVRVDLSRNRMSIWDEDLEAWVENANKVRSRVQLPTHSFSGPSDPPVKAPGRVDQEVSRVQAPRVGKEVSNKLDLSRDELASMFGLDPDTFGAGMSGATSDYPDFEAMAAMVDSGGKDGDVIAAKVLGLRYTPSEQKYSSRYDNVYSEPAKVTLVLRIRRKDYEFDIIDEVKSGFGMQRISGAAVKKMEDVMPDFLNVEIARQGDVLSYDLIDSDLAAWMKNAMVKRTRARKTAVESVLQYIADLISENIF